MAREAAQSAFDALHGEKSAQVWHNGDWSKWSSKPGPEHPFRYDHGTTVYVSSQDEDPGDEFVTDPKARPASVRPADETPEEG